MDGAVVTASGWRRRDGGGGQRGDGVGGTEGETGETGFALRKGARIDPGLRTEAEKLLAQWQESDSDLDADDSDDDYGGPRPSTWALLRSTDTPLGRARSPCPTLGRARAPSPVLERLTRPTASSAMRASTDRSSVHAGLGGLVSLTAPFADDSVSAAVRRLEAQERTCEQEQLLPTSTVIWPRCDPVALMEARHASTKEARGARTARREQAARTLQKQLAARDYRPLNTVEGQRWLRSAAGREWQRSAAGKEWVLEVAAQRREKAKHASTLVAVRKQQHEKPPVSARPPAPASASVLAARQRLRSPPLGGATATTVKPSAASAAREYGRVAQMLSKYAPQRHLHPAQAHDDEEAATSSALVTPRTLDLSDGKPLPTPSPSKMASPPGSSPSPPQQQQGAAGGEALTGGAMDRERSGPAHKRLTLGADDNDDTDEATVGHTELNAAKQPRAAKQADQGHGNAHGPTLAHHNSHRRHSQAAAAAEAKLLERAVAAARETLRTEAAEAAAREASRREEAEKVARLKAELAAVEAAVREAAEARVAAAAAEEAVREKAKEVQVRSTRRRRLRSTVQAWQRTCAAAQAQVALAQRHWHWRAREAYCQRWRVWARMQADAKVARWHEAKLQLARQQAAAAEAHWLRRVWRFGWHNWCYAVRLQQGEREQELETDRRRHAAAQLLARRRRQQEDDAANAAAEARTTAAVAMETAAVDEETADAKALRQLKGTLRLLDRCEQQQQQDGDGSEEASMSAAAAGAMGVVGSSDDEVTIMTASDERLVQQATAQALAMLGGHAGTTQSHGYSAALVVPPASAATVVGAAALADQQAGEATDRWHAAMEARTAERRRRRAALAADYAAKDARRSEARATVEAEEAAAHRQARLDARLARRRAKAKEIANAVCVAVRQRRHRLGLRRARAHATKRYQQLVWGRWQRRMALLHERVHRAAMAVEHVRLGGSLHVWRRAIARLRLARLAGDAAVRGARRLTKRLGAAGRAWACLCMAVARAQVIDAQHALGLRLRWACGGRGGVLGEWRQVVATAAQTRTVLCERFGRIMRGVVLAAAVEQWTKRASEWRHERAVAETTQALRGKMTEWLAEL